MNNKKIVIINFVLLFYVLLGQALAHAPSKIDLTYDADKKVLHLEMTHVSTNLLKHYIRKIIIYKNEEEVQNIYLVKQTTASTVVEDVPLEAKDGDVIRVKAICAEAGYKEESLTIREKEKDKK